MKLHHIGRVVADLKEAIDYYKDNFGLECITEQVVDANQKVEVVFVDVGFGKDLTLELIKPIGADSPVSKFLEKGGGLHHLCFEVEDIQQAMIDFREKGALILGNPVPGKGHNDRSTLWLYTSKKELVELIQMEKE